MKLRTIELRNFRGVGHCLVNFEAGATIIEGENEVGKSSIAEALRVLREVKASSNRADIKALQPAGRDVGPEVRLTMTTGPYELTYFKRWLRSPATELTVTAPAPEQHTSDPAHERFLAILRETIDVDLLTELDVVQGSSLSQPVLARIGALREALDRTGQAAGSSDELLGAINDEYAKYFTASGRENRAFLASAEAVRTAAAAVAEIEGQLSDVDALVAEHSEVSRRLEALQPQLAAAARGCDDLRRRDLELGELRDRVAQAKSSLKLALAQQETARRAADERRAAHANVKHRAAAVEAAELAAKATSEVLAEHEERLVSLRDAEKRARAARDSAARVAKDAADAASLVRAKGEAQALDARLAAIDAESKKLQAAELAVRDNPASDRALQEVVDLETTWRVAEAALAAAAARVSVTPLCAKPVAIGEATVTEPASFELLDDTTIEVPGVVRVELTPGAQPVDLRRAQEAAHKDLAEALREFGVESLQALRARVSARREAERERDKAQSAYEALLAGQHLPALTAQAADLKRRIETLAKRVAAQHGAEGATGADSPSTHTPEVAGPPTPASLSEAEDCAHAAAINAERAEQELAECAKRVSDLVAETDRARDADIRANSELEAANHELETVTASLTTARMASSDADLNADLASATALAEACSGEVDAANARLAMENPDALAQDLENALALVKRRETEIEQARNRLIEIDALLGDRGSRGLADALADAQQREDSARASHQRLHRQAMAARLLKETMDRHRRLAQERYVAPFRERIEALGRPLFGSDFQVEISPELEVVSRTVNAQTVPFTSLSAGAREQLALLGRIACAELVDPARGAPLILDDTFGFADPARLARLNVILNAASKKTQIVVLTCQPDRFDKLGSASVVRLPRTAQA